MIAHLVVDPTATNREGLAAIALNGNQGQQICSLDIQFSELQHTSHNQACATDFLLLASSVYALDRVVLRSTASDAWSREIELHIPVSDSGAWQSIADQLNECISFLTGDTWKFNFHQRTTDPIKRTPNQGFGISSVAPISAVSLFSGGLDSLIGVIDWLESNRNNGLLLVGHHDAEITGPLSDQRGLLDPLRLAYPNRIATRLVRVGKSASQRSDGEITLRSRSLIFIALGAFVSNSQRPPLDLLIPENGTIALNVPLTPSRRGSCSTRTAHPHFLNSLNSILRQVGIDITLSNPLHLKTKGEAVSQCANIDLLKRTVALSVSCAKRGHRRHWTRRTVKECGRCMPCIYRRAALHAMNWDDEVYGDDICKGEVNVNAEGEKPNDLRACLSFLRLDLKAPDIAKLLVANGKLDINLLPQYSSMVLRTMNEIRQLLRDKATPTIKSMANI